MNVFASALKKIKLSENNNTSGVGFKYFPNMLRLHTIEITNRVKN